MLVQKSCVIPHQRPCLVSWMVLNRGPSILIIAELDTNASLVTSFGEIQPGCAPSWAFGLGRPLNVNVSYEMQSNKLQTESVWSEKAECFSLS
jgi:hypothetical protein